MERFSRTALVAQWWELHQLDLERAWAAARSGESAGTIEPHARRLFFGTDRNVGVRLAEIADELDITMGGGASV